MSTAVCALLARTRPLSEAVSMGKAYVDAALRDAPLELSPADGARTPHLLHEFYGSEGLP
jgi:hydroxymethylpyrimidine/phosphomethylpyrimidine kinase